MYLKFRRARFAARIAVLAFAIAAALSGARAAAQDSTSSSLQLHEIIRTEDGARATPTAGQPAAPPVRELSLDFRGATHGWRSWGPTSDPSPDGLCIRVMGPDFLGAEWTSPYQLIPLVDHAVWRLRLNMTSDQANAGEVPLWDLIIQNLDMDAEWRSVEGDQAFYGDYYFLDTAGSANAVRGPAVGRSEFDVWFTPAAALTPQWRNVRTGAIAAINDADNDMRLIFRLKEAGRGYGAEFDSGRVCLTGLLVDRFDLAAVETVEEVYRLDALTSGSQALTVRDVIGRGAVGGGSRLEFGEEGLGIFPANRAGWANELTYLAPGDAVNPAVNETEYGQGRAAADNYPLPWESDTLYQLLVDVSAPDAVAEHDGPDSLRLGFDTKTIELYGESSVLTGLGRAGMPRRIDSVGGVQTYTMFWWGHRATISERPDAARQRWKVDVINTAAYNRPHDNTRNQGGIMIHGVRVRKVRFPGM